MPNKFEFKDRSIEALQAPLAGQVVYWDVIVPSFGIRVAAGGAKSWIVQRWVSVFDPATGEQRRQSKRFTLGRYPAMPLAGARLAAREAIELIAKGKDPGQVKADALEAQRRDAMEQHRERQRTFAAIRDRFITEYCDSMRADGKTPLLRAKTAKEYARVLRDKTFRDWEPRPIGDIAKSDVNQIIAAVIKKRGGYVANRVFAYLRKMFNWTESQGIIEIAPTAKLKKPAIEEARERVLHERELFYLWRAVEAAPVFTVALRLLIVTAQRREEVSALRRPELENLRGAAALWRLPTDRAKNRTAHLVPLSTMAVNLICQMPETDSELVFTTTGKSPISGFSKAKVNIDAAIAKMRAETKADDTAAIVALDKLLSEPWRIHDFRRTAATCLAEFGTPRDVVEKILNHRSGTRAGVAGTYNRSELLTERRVALELWTEYLRRVTAECLDDQAIESLRNEMRREYICRLSGGALHFERAPLRLVA